MRSLTHFTLINRPYIERVRARGRREANQKGEEKGKIHRAILRFKGKKKEREHKM